MNTVLRLPATLAKTGLGRTVLYERVSNGTWPHPFRISANVVGWLESEVDRMNRAAAAGYSPERLRALVRELEAARVAEAA